MAYLEDGRTFAMEIFSENFLGEKSQKNTRVGVSF